MKHAWYAGTDAGLLLIQRSNTHATVDSLGLSDCGGFRAPVVVDRANPRRLYAGTQRAGALRSDDGGQSWREINQGILYKDIWSLVQHARTGTLYAGTSPAGVFRSDDGGESWQACEALWQLPSTRQWCGPVAPFISRMKDLTIDEDDPNLVLGAIEEGWLVRSPDGGASWEQVDQGVPHDTHTIRVVPGRGKTLVLGTNEGWLRSEDAGQTWTASNHGLAARRYTPAPLVTRADRPGVLFSSVTGAGPGDWRKPGGGDAAFCRSEDGGLSWQTLTDGLPQPMAAIPRAIAIDPSNPLGYVAGTTDGCLWATDDSSHFDCLLRGLGTVMSLTPAILD